MWTCFVEADCLTETQGVEERWLGHTQGRVIGNDGRRRNVMKETYLTVYGL